MEKYKGNINIFISKQSCSGDEPRLASHGWDVDPDFLVFTKFYGMECLQIRTSLLKY